VIIIDRGNPQLFRDLSIGGSFFTENLSKDLNISFDDAEKVLKGLPVKDIQPEQLQTVLDMNMQNLLEEIEKTFSFYEAGEKKDKKIEHIFLSGGLSKLKDLPSNFEQKYNIKTEIFNPFRRISYDDKKFDNIYFEEMAALFGVATGLATRKLD
jgi:type IV pilus assembly protein PilM